jgi:hypothetical protein
MLVLKKYIWEFLKCILIAYTNKQLDKVKIFYIIYIESSINEIKGD